MPSRCYVSSSVKLRAWLLLVLFLYLVSCDCMAQAS